LRSASVPVFVAPGNRDFVGPLGGYSRHEWPENVTVFESDRFAPAELAEGVTLWGAAHTEAHRSRSFLDRFAVDREGVNLALFHGAERSGAEREPTSDPCASFDEAAIEAAGFDHALVGHYQQAHFGWMHTYPGALIAHEFGYGPTGGAVVVTLGHDGTIEREHLEIASPGLYDVEVDLTGAKTNRKVMKRVKAALTEASGPIRLHVVGRLSPDVVVRREELIDLASRPDGLRIDWAVGVDVDLDQLGDEETVRGQFVRDVLAEGLDDDRRNRMLLAGLRALGGSDVLEGPG
jgi:hypothetical protein